MTSQPQKSLSFKKYCLDPVVDHAFAWFLPAWKKKSLEAKKHLLRYINYNEDILPEEKLQTYRELEADISLAILQRDKDKATTLSEKIDSMLGSVHDGKQSSLAETVEIFFVIIVVFLGIRDYIVQPFRIPTGSMQPSLNGIRAIPFEEEPSFVGKMKDLALYGSSYVNEKAETKKKITGFKGDTKFLLFTVTNVSFDDGSQIQIPAAEAETRRYFMNQKARFPEEQNSPFRTYLPGDTIVKARFDAGDLILVNKMAYHFRKPERGEVFVFDTRGIEGIASNGSTTGQEGGTHYVKRLCGVPGDSLAIENKHLIINGNPATEKTIQTVAAGQSPYNSVGYEALPAAKNLWDKSYYIVEGQTVKLKNDPLTPQLKEYVALGDNTPKMNSFDSRYWGPVRQYNIVGPASFALWPFTSHWGIIP